MRSRERRGARLAFLAGVLILLGGGTGSAALYLDLLRFLADRLAFLGPLLVVAALTLPFLAALGGVAVMTGAFLYRDGSPVAGLLLVEIGSGAGFVGVALALAGALDAGFTGLRGLAGAFLGLSGLGVALSLVARAMLVAAKVR